jgi:hypothetical protein
MSVTTYPDKSMYFWIRVSRDPKKQEMILFFGDEGDLNYFNSRQSYPCFALQTPPGSAVSLWSISNAGTTFTTKQNLAIAEATAAAENAGWTVIKGTDQTRAFYNN